MRVDESLFKIVYHSHAASRNANTKGYETFAPRLAADRRSAGESSIRPLNAITRRPTRSYRISRRPPVAVGSELNEPHRRGNEPHRRRCSGKRQQTVCTRRRHPFSFTSPPAAGESPLPVPGSAEHRARRCRCARPHGLSHRPAPMWDRPPRGTGCGPGTGRRRPRASCS